MAFDGDNLLGLTYKICEGNLPELPDRYGENGPVSHRHLLVQVFRVQSISGVLSSLGVR